MSPSHPVQPAEPTRPVETYTINTRNPGHYVLYNVNDGTRWVPRDGTWKRAGDALTWRERMLFLEAREVEALLAEALGYEHDPGYGWLVGDHTPVTLAMEAVRRGVLPEKGAEGNE